MHALTRHLTKKYDFSRMALMISKKEWTSGSLTSQKAFYNVVGLKFQRSHHTIKRVLTA